MEVKVNIIDTLFTTIPKDTVVASYTVDEDNVQVNMASNLYYVNEPNKTIHANKNINSNNIEAIHFTVRNWVSGEQVEINDMYPRVVSKLQNKFNKPNTIYKVTKDLDLNHCVLTIPEGCTLQFDGGSISNSSLSGNFTKIIADSSTVIFGQQIHIEGSWDIADIYDEWFWFDTDPSYISNDTIKNILALSNDSINNTIHFDANRTYYFELPYKGRANLGDDVRPDYWKLNTPDYDFLRIFTGVTSNTHLIVNNTLQMLPTNQGAYFIFQIENKENIEISGTGTINGDAKDHLYTDPFAGTLYYGEWGHVLNFRSCNNVVVRDITVGYAFGDGIACGNAAYDIDGVKTANPATTNVLIDGVKVLYARRNGISVGGNNYSITNVYFEGCGSDEIKGTAPMAGIDFENDYVEVEPSGLCTNVTMSNCKFKNNKYDVSSTIRDDLYEVPRGELVTITDCNFTAPLRLNRTNGLTFNTCHIKGISSHDNSISPWYASKDLIFNNCVFDELNPYLPISAEEQNKKFINPTYPQDIKYTTTFQHSLPSGKALKFTIPKPLVGEVELTAFCSNPNYSAIYLPITTQIFTFGNSQRLTGIRDIKVKTVQDSTPRYSMYRNTPVFSYINYEEDTDNFIIYFTIGGELISNPLGGNTSVNIFLTSKTKFITIEAPVSTNPGVAGMYGGKWSGLSAITKQSIDLSSIPSTVTFPNKEMFPSNLLADLPTSLTPDRVGFSQFVLDVSYKRPVFWDSYSSVFRTADGNRALERRVTSLVELDALTAKLTTEDRGYVVYYTVTTSYLTWTGTDWMNEDGSLFSKVKYIKQTNSIDILNVMFSYSNVIYKVCADVDLDGGTLTIASGSTLDFQGGSFSNGTITFSNTTIVANSSNYIFKNIIFKGSLKCSDFYVDWVGASVSNEDNSDFIKQAVIVSSTFRVPIVFNSVIYNITKPIILDTLINNVTIKGNKARIQKVNSITTDITEAVPTYGGNVNINYACIFCITEGHYWTIRDLAFYGGTTEAYNNYGIFIIKGSNFLIENVGFTYCSIAMYVFGLWMSNFTKITCTDVNIGFNFNSARLNDIVGNSGTSICFNNCYVNRCNTGFNLKWLNYSVLNSCAVDYATTNAYTYADKSCVTMNGCGSEASKSWINLLSNSNVVLNACQFLSTTAENTSTVVLFNSKILFNNCAFQDYVTKAIFTNKESNITLIDTDVSITDTTLVFNISGVYYIKLKNKVYIITYNGKRIENIIDYSNLLKGTTDNRPILASINEGFEYYDSTLKKKILWNGSTWTNFDGTALT